LAGRTHSGGEALVTCRSQPPLRFLNIAEVSRRFSSRMFSSSIMCGFP